MTRALSILCCFALFACGGSAPPPEAPPASDPALAAPAPAEASSPQPASGDEVWEGEAEATSTGSSTGGEAAPAAGSGAEETRTVEVLTKIIKDNRQAVRDCYDAARKDLPSLEGDMVIFVLLDPEGKVKKIELNQQASTLKSPAVVDCAIKVIQGLDFPPSSRGMETTLNYPFNFKPR